MKYYLHEFHNQQVMKCYPRDNLVGNVFAG